MTKQIQLSQGKAALVNDQDYEHLSQYKWFAQLIYKKFYATRHAGKKYVYMHREVSNAPADRVVDHINGDGLDNRRENLRICTKAENLRNRGKQADNTSGYKGVFKDGEKYLAYIKVNRKQIRLGFFSDPVEAAKAYDAAAIKLHGEFAKTNFEARS